MMPYFVTVKDSPVRLYQLKDGRFQMIARGTPGPFMSGYGYLLVERGLAEFLECLPVEGAAFKEAVIYDRESGTEYRDYVEVIVSRHFSSDRIDDIDLDGFRIMTMGNEYVFVSPLLKERLEQSGFGYLVFSEGLSDFAA